MALYGRAAGLHALLRTPSAYNCLDAARPSARDAARYERHLALPQFGVEGQRRLKAARVLIRRRRWSGIAGSRCISRPQGSGP